MYDDQGTSAADSNDQGTSAGDSGDKRRRGLGRGRGRGLEWGRILAFVVVALLLTAGLVGVSRVVEDLRGEAVVDQGQAVRVAATSGPPTRLDVPSLGIRADVVPIEMDRAGVLTPPADVSSVGWWRRSAEPGASAGKVLITGHTVRIGDGALDEIGSLEPGAEVLLHSPDGATRYRTTDVRTLTQEQVAARATRLFGQDEGEGALVLVTCTDWDGSAWRSNIIVRAELVGGVR